jgi:hypothetical protein
MELLQRAASARDALAAAEAAEAAKAAGPRAAAPPPAPASRNTAYAGGWGKFSTEPTEPAALPGASSPLETSVAMTSDGGFVVQRSQPAAPKGTRAVVDEPVGGFAGDKKSRFVRIGGVGKRAASSRFVRSVDTATLPEGSVSVKAGVGMTAVLGSEKKSEGGGFEWEHAYFTAAFAGPARLPLAVGAEEIRRHAAARRAARANLSALFWQRLSTKMHERHSILSLAWPHSRAEANASTDMLQLRDEQAGQVLWNVVAVDLMLSVVLTDSLAAAVFAAAGAGAVALLLSRLAFRRANWRRADHPDPSATRYTEAVSRYIASKKEGRAHGAASSRLARGRAHGGLALAWLLNFCIFGGAIAVTIVRGRCLAQWQTANTIVAWVVAMLLSWLVVEPLLVLTMVRPCQQHSWLS